MSDSKIVVLTTFISLIVALITSWFTSKIAFKSDIKKYIYARKEVLYFELCDEFDKLIMNTKLIYDVEYKEKLLMYKPRIKLVASKSIILKYKCIVDVIHKYHYDLYIFNKSNSPYEDDIYLDIGYSKDGEEDSYHNVPEFIETEFEEKLQNYKNDNSKKSKDKKVKIFKMLGLDSIKYQFEYEEL